MRFLGIILILAGVIAFSIITGAFSFILQLWYFLAVVVIASGALIINYSFKDIYRAKIAFLKKSDNSKDDNKLFSRLFKAAKTYFVAAGSIVSLLGAIAVFAGGKPPSVVMFAESLTGLLFGVVFGYLLCLPAAKYFKEMTK
ncbi:MAG: hypothetical protein KAR07_06275 [Spirochaetes bacterium]|nr:hypothetical protein [Spirochaetota bacterium]MCK5267751.1 hypothetical protein [Spirochaetota bacterium]